MLNRSHVDVCSRFSHKCFGFEILEDQNALNLQLLNNCLLRIAVESVGSCCNDEGDGTSVLRFFLGSVAISGVHDFVVHSNILRYHKRHQEVRLPV